MFGSKKKEKKIRKVVVERYETEEFEVGACEVEITLADGQILNAIVRGSVYQSYSGYGSNKANPPSIVTGRQAAQNMICNMQGENTYTNDSLNPSYSITGKAVKARILPDSDLPYKYKLNVHHIDIIEEICD